MSYYILYMSPARDRATMRQWREVKNEFKKAHVKPLELDAEFYLENDLLKKTDTATSYVSIEGRVPLLDSEIIHNAKHFEDQKLEGGMLKAFLKKILTQYLPADMVYRPKSGFGINIATVFKKSKYLSKDFDQALLYLKEKGITPQVSGDKEKFIQKYPSYCFALISLYRSLSNNERL
jgi:asparagine synthetase B (glutamine-hydrolysing)